MIPYHRLENYHVPKPLAEEAQGIKGCIHFLQLTYVRYHSVKVTQISEMGSIQKEYITIDMTPYT